MTGNYYAHLGYFDTYCRIKDCRDKFIYYNTRSSGQFLGELTVKSILVKRYFFYFEKESKSALEHLKYVGLYSLEGVNKMF